MLSILKTVLIVYVFFLQLCYSSVIARRDQNGWHPAVNHPWWWSPPHNPWAPSHTSQSYSAALPTSTRKSSTGAAFPTHLTTIRLPTSSKTTAGGGSCPAPTTLTTVVLPPTSTGGSPDKPTSLSLVIAPSYTSASRASTKTSLSVVIVPSSSSTAKKPTATISLSTISVIPLPTSSNSHQSTPSTSSAKPTSPTSVGGHWKPAAGTNWQIELSGTVTDTTLPVDVFDLDLFDTPTATISRLKQNGKKVICYFSAGSFEDWRSDKGLFQAGDKGNAMANWPGEYWLNTKSDNVRSIMTARIQLAKDKGCDGVDPDNVDGYDNSNGVGLTQASAVDYLTHLADAAHSRGLSIGLKNAGGLVGSVLPIMEWHVNEQCLQFGECNLLKPFIDQNKPVFHIEYPDEAPNVTPAVKSKNCQAPSAKGFSTVLKTIDLNAWVDPC